MLHRKVRHHPRAKEYTVHQLYKQLRDDLQWRCHCTKNNTASWYVYDMLVEKYRGFNRRTFDGLLHQLEEEFN